MKVTIKWKDTNKEDLVFTCKDFYDYEDYMYHAVHCGEIVMEEILTLTTT